MTRSAGRKGKFRDRPRRRGRDRPRVSIKLSDSPLTDPKRWVERKIEVLARSVVQAGTYLDLMAAIQRIARASYACVRDSEWGLVELQAIHAYHASYELSDLALQAVSSRDLVMSVSEMFMVELLRCKSGEEFSTAHRRVYVMLCHEVLDWVVQYPITPPGFLKEEEKPN